MKRLFIGLLVMTAACAVVSSSYSGEECPQVPGKVAMYNTTTKSVELTIVGQESNLGIDPGGKLTRQFNPNAPSSSSSGISATRPRRRSAVFPLKG